MRLFAAGLLLLCHTQVAQAQTTAWEAVLVDELTELFPDRPPPEGAREFTGHSPRGVPAGVHMYLTGLEAGASVEFELLHGGEPIERVRWYRLHDVPVEENTGLGSRTEQYEGKTNPHVIRRAPFRVFEALEPVDSSLEADSDVLALRIELPLAADAAVGTRDLGVAIRCGDRRLELDWKLIVHEALVPPVSAGTLKYTNWFNPRTIASQHELELWSEPFWEMLERYARLMVHGRQNTAWLRWADHFHDADGDGLPELERERFVRWIRTFRDAGLSWIEGAPVSGRPGGDWSRPDLELRIVRVPATGEAGRRALAHMGAQVHEVLREHGWLDSYLQHVADEPTDVNAEDYVALADLVREALPGVPILEATMSRAVAGGVDHWCPQVQKFQAQREFFEERRALGERIWVYTCLVPGGPWLNRLLDQERLRPVWIGWAAARYDLEGFLHWGLNHYKADPFERSVVDHPAQPNTKNKLPAGDTHVIYPGPQGPWSGQRFEAHRIGLEDRELLVQLLARDEERAEAIIEQVFRAFDDYEKEVGAYRAARAELLRALD
jgi:hypothetical protein